MSTIETNKIYCESNLDTMARMPDNFLHCVVTSPPYWGLRDYGTDGTHWPAVTYQPMPGMTEITVPEQHAQLGLEETPESFVGHIVHIFREVRRVLREDGTLWLNFGDSYCGSGKASGRTWENGSIPNMSRKQSTNTGSLIGRMPDPYYLKPKDLCGIPWRVAFALQADGWYLRSDIIWHKLNPMPESVKSRPTKSHEYVFMLAKSKKYYYDYEAVKEPVADSTKGRGKVSFGGSKGRNYQPDKNDPNYRNGSEQWGRTFDYKKSCKNGMRNRRTVWSMANEPFKGAHFAVFPTKLVEPCILAGCPEGGIIYDPFGGSGTTAEVAIKNNRNWIISEISQMYVDECASVRINSALAE